jgi:hypothetical protein
MSLKRLATRVKRATPPPGPCPACAARPSLVRVAPGDPGPEPCPECGGAPALVEEVVVATRADVGRARGRADDEGLGALDSLPYDPAPGR